MEKTYEELARLRVINKLKNENSHNRLQLEIEKLKDKLLDSNLSHKSFNRLLKSIEILQSASVVASSLEIGDQAPEFELENTLKKKVKLSQILKNGKVILTFYRGGWCPYSYLNLRALQKIYPIVKKSSTTIIAISPENIQNAKKTIERNNLSFDLLSDKANKVSERYRLISKLEKEKSSVLDVSLESAIENGDISYHLPVPAIFIIDEWQTIRFAFQDSDLKKQVNINLLLDCLRHI